MNIYYFIFRISNIFFYIIIEKIYSIYLYIELSIYRIEKKKFQHI